MEPRRQSPWWTAVEFAIAIVLPIAGLVIAVVLFATKHTRDAAIVMLATVVGAVFGVLLYL